MRLRTEGDISSQSAEDVYLEHLQSGESVASIVAAKGLRQMNDTSELTAVIDKVIAANEAAVADVRAGKEQALKFLTGQVMKETRGQANAAVVAQDAYQKFLRIGVPCYTAEDSDLQLIIVNY